MILFLYGPDTYRSRQKLNEIIEHYKKIHKSGLNLRYFDCQETDFQDFRDEIRQISMFKEKKLVILTNIFLSPEFKDNLLKNGETFEESDIIILIYVENQIPEKEPLISFLKKYAKSQEFELLKGQKLKNWAKKEFNKYQAEIDPSALEKLIEFVGNNLWRLSNEIQKLVCFKKNIKIKDVELLVKPKIETDIFATIDSLALKNKKQALELIHQHLEKGDHPLYLLSMINFQFRNLLIIKDLIEKYKSPYLLTKITHLHPYIVKKSYSQAQKFTIQELKKIYQKIFQVDLSIKTGKIDPETALDLLIAAI